MEVEHGVQKVLAGFIRMRSQNWDLGCGLRHLKRRLEGRSTVARGFLGPHVWLGRGKKRGNGK